MADRNVILKIRILDAQRDFLKGQVDLEIRSCTLNQSVLQQRVDASCEISIRGLRGAALGSYAVIVTPAALFEPQVQLVDLPVAGSVTIDFIFTEELSQESL